MIAILWCLADGEMRPGQLERALPGTGRSVVARRLRKMLESSLATCESRPGLAARERAYSISGEDSYALADAGRALLEVAAAAAHWERVWGATALQGRPAGSGVIALLSDSDMRGVLVSLADGALEPKELDGEVLDTLGSAALRRRLLELERAGLLVQHKFGRSRRFELTPAARRLAAVAMLAGRWEWRWLRPDGLVLGRDLVDLLRVVAPAARLPASVSGICQLRLQTDAHCLDILLAAHGGSVGTLAAAPSAPAQVIGVGAPEAWCDTLLSREGAIAISGDERLLRAIVAAINAALLD